MRRFETVVGAVFGMGLIAGMAAGQAPDMPACGCGLPHAEDLIRPAEAAPYTPRLRAFSDLAVTRSPIAATGPCTEDGSRLDILIVYTSQFAAGAGSMVAVQAYADDAIAELNLSLANSGIATTAQLAGLVELVDFQSGSIFTNLADLRTPGNGRYDEVHGLRDLLRADIVSLFVENASGACGVANIGVQAGLTPRPDLAFNVVNRSCLGTSLYTFSHEVGHNLGLLHDVAQDPCLLQGAERSAHGYVEPGGAFSTIMATGTAAPRLQRYSDPGVLEGGVPAGEVGVAENALIAQQSVAVASRFRDRDQDIDGLCDADQIAADASLDCNGNGILDQFDIDLDRNGTPDVCDIALGAADTDLDGVPDAAELPRLYVDIDAAPGGTGASWVDAIDDLQFALALARASGDVSEIWIAEGTYTPGVHRGVPFDLVGGVALYGGFNGTEATLGERDIDVHETVLSGDLAGDDDASFTNIADNSVQVIYGFEEAGVCVLDGLTVTGGYSVEAQSCAGNSQGTGDGGGLFALFCEIDIRRCLFTRNAALRGGGLFLPDVTDWSITDSVLLQNRAIGPSVTSSSAGAYLSGSGSPSTFLRNRVLGNISDGGAGGVFFIGGSPTVESSEFSGNVSKDGSGAGFIGRLMSDAVFTNLTVANNSNEGNWAAAGGNLSNSVNSSGNVITNSIFWNNLIRTATSPTLSDNQQLQISGSSGFTPESLTIDSYAGYLTGNDIDGNDPMFVDALGPDGIAGTLDDDLRLDPASPAVDAGSASLAPPSSSDLDNEPRLVGPAVDRGAYEVQGAGCVGDVTTTGATLVGQAGFGEADGIVDLDDLGYYLGFWLAGDAAVADVTMTGATLAGQAGFGEADGSVDLDDLGYFLGFWLDGCP